MKVKKLLCLAIFLALSFSIAYGDWSKKPELRWTQLYRYDTRKDDHQLYTNRVSFTFDYLNKEESPLFKLTPYFEIRRNVDQGLWERKELGIEIGRDVTGWFYIGEAIQGVWVKDDYRDSGIYKKRDYAESETKLLFSRTLLDNEYVNLKGFILDEFTYDFGEGRGMRNEIAIGVIMPIGKYAEADIHWRHIDRIGHYDSDVLETVLTLVF